MKKAKISVVVPIYNVEKYLRRCLDRLVGQTLRNIEIILVDDCGHDHSMTIAQEFAANDDRIKIISHDKNRGLAAARNTGIRNSSAPFIMFCDSDDSYEPAMCEKMLGGIESSGADIAACGIRVVYEPGTDGIKQSDDKYYKLNFKGMCEMNDDVRKNTHCSAWNKIYRRKFLKTHDIWFPDGIYFEDAYFVNACFAVAKNIFFVDDSLYCYVRRHGSIMSETFAQKKGMSIDHLKIAVFLHDFMKRRGVLKKIKDYMGFFFFHCLDFALRYEADPQSKDAIFEMADEFIAREGWSPGHFSAPVAQMFGMLRNHDYPVQIKPLSFWEKIISIKNTSTHKVITLLGVKLKIKRNIYILRNEIAQLHHSHHELYHTHQELRQGHQELHRADQELHREYQELHQAHLELQSGFRYMSECLTAVNPSGLILSFWETWGAKEELLRHCDFTSHSPHAWLFYDHHFWLVYLSCLIEIGETQKAQSLLQKYVYYKGLSGIERCLTVAKFALPLGYTNQEMEKAALVYDHLLENRKKDSFKKTFEGKTVAVVGNGPSELGKQKGKEIDSHDLVVRFNNYQTAGFEIDYGSKADIWIRGAGGDDLIDREEKFQLITWGADFDHWFIRDQDLEILYRQVSSGENVGDLDSHDQWSLRKASGIDIPTTGLAFIWALFQKFGNVDNVNFYGFNFCQETLDTYSTHYFPDRDEEEMKRRSAVHRLDKEARFLRKLLQRNH